jgi:hypothetical protein
MDEHYYCQLLPSDILLNELHHQLEILIATTSGAIIL